VDRTTTDHGQLTTDNPMFERSHEKLAPTSVFLKRMAGSVGFAVLLLFFVLLVGVAGYHWIDHLSWVDSILEAAMILGGMGPVNPLTTNSAKLFAAGYALFCGVVFIGIMGILLTPIVHRVLHKFHVKETEDG
jgi:hypothetical protein